MRAWGVVEGSGRGDGEGDAGLVGALVVSPVWDGRVRCGAAGKFGTRAKMLCESNAKLTLLKGGVRPFQGSLF